MDVSSIKDIIEQVFSKSGYKVANFNISLPSVVSTKIEKNEDGIKISFQDNLPKVKTKKFFISIGSEIENIFFGSEKGSIKLKHFPDFVFSYKEESDEKRFGSRPVSLELSQFQQEISNKYPDRERKKIADLALKFANEWYTISSENGVVFTGCNKTTKDKFNKDCFEFVHQSILKSEEIKAKSAILSVVLLYFVVPAIINWVVTRFLNRVLK